MIDYSFKEKLIRYLDAGFPVVYIEGFEDRKIDEAIKFAACGREIIEWNGLNGFVDFSTKIVKLDDYNLEQTLGLLKDDQRLDRKLLVLKDVHRMIEEDKIVALLRGIAHQINEGLDASIIIVSDIVKIPREIEKFVTILEMDVLSQDEIRDVVKQFVDFNELDDISLELLEELSSAFKGLSEFEINSILALAYADDGELSRSDISFIFDQKQQMIRKAGILEMVPLRESLDDIGGLENLKLWLQRKAKVYKNIEKAKEFGVDLPKGVLIAGVPGCGKSLNAKACAHLFEIPLLKLDMGRIMGKYVGESETNMRKAIALAEAISPCVIWIDELEKAFSGIGSGNGAEVTTRLFGYFLSWMQDKKSPTFVVATANNISHLPPEMLRKGRFDEIFYVGLPNEKERKKIFEIHINKRRPMDLDEIDLDQIVAKSDGYSGADIEGVVIESIESVFANDMEALSTKDILTTMKKTNSLSVIMKKSLEDMQKVFKENKFKNASDK